MRYAAGSSMYFAQGIPYGLMNIAVPAWLASQGVGAGEIASFLAIIILPWAFKLLSGPLMDRYQFLAMGRRRPWVLGAQLGMTLSFFSLTFVDNPPEQVGLLMMLGLFINIFAATQDVAVDGMAIDVTPVNEQGRLNGFMVFGKAVGWGVTSAVTGTMLVKFGLGVTAMAAAAVQAIVLLGFAMTKERRGERRLPWSSGDVVSERRAGKSFRSLVKGLNAVLWTRVSMILMAIMIFDGFIGGYGHALMPIAAINLFGFTTPEWSQLVAVMGLAGAGAALVLGPMIDRFGAKTMLVLTISLVAIHAFLLAETQYLWENATYVKVMLSAWVMLGAVTAALIAIIFFHRHRPGASDERKVAPTYTVGMNTSGAGMYFSGAMRCPKCRSDMVQIVIDDTEIDRCSSCHGRWFDAGELTDLATLSVADIFKRFITPTRE